MKSKELLLEFYDLEDDEIDKAELSDTRRPRLTIKHLNKLRKMKDLQKIEREDHLKVVKQIYGQMQDSSEF